MKKKKYAIIIALCLCFILILIVNKSINKLENPDSIDGKTAENQLLLSGMGIFSEKYNGELKTKDITEKLNDITKLEFPKIYNEIKEFDNTELDTYYEQHKEELQNVFGKSSIEEFQEFSKNLQKITDINLDSWYNLVINKETFKNVSDKQGYSYFEYRVNYENNKIINFSMYISREKNTVPTFIINIK